MFQKPSKYQKVSQNDSEDDEVLLYAATPLNQNGEHIDDDQAFGTGVYNRDLRLNLSPPEYLQAKAEAKLKERRHMIYSGLLCAGLIVVLLGVACTIVVYAQVYVPQNLNITTSTDTPTTATTDDSICITPAPPLPGKINACKKKKPPIELPTKTPTNMITSKPESVTPIPQSEPVTVITSQSQSESATSQSEPVSPQSEPVTSQNDPVTPQNEPVTPQSEPVTPQSEPVTQHEETTSSTDKIPSETPTLASATGAITSVNIPDEKTTNLASPWTTTTEVTDKESDPLSAISPTSPSTTDLSKEQVTTSSLSVDITEMNELVVDTAVTENNLPTNPDTTQPSQLVNSQPELNSHTVDWIKDILPAATELSLQFFDMNRDGIQDILTAKLTDQCTCSLLALDGLSGEIVWQINVNFDVFSLRCILDSNQDDVIDCIATGRYGGFISISGVDGSIIWTIDTDITFPKYNYYFPLLIEDLDQDGVPDLINTHGGDTAYEPEEENRSPGSFVVVSGRTGGKLMESILIPDGRETYCSPVLFRMGDIDMILFGSGGETLSGSLWGITLASIRNKVSKNMAEITQYKLETDDSFHPCFMDVESLRPAFNKTFFDNSYQLSECPNLSHTFVPNSYDLCLYEIHRSPSKGILLPPLILDLNNDGRQDLLVSTFDGHLFAYNGANLATLLWEAYNPNTESYSLPIPLFYNEDPIPDLFIRANVGEWSSQYSSSILYLIDGQSGSTLWSLDSIYSVMLSGLSLVADIHGQDAVLFFAIGEKRNRVLHHGNMQEESHDHVNASFDQDELWNLTPEDSFPNPDDELDSFLHYCDHTMEELSVHVYLLTREMIEEGEVKPIMTEKPFVFKGKVPGNFSVDLKRQANNKFNPSSSAYQVDDTMFGEALEDMEEHFPSNNMPHSSDPNDISPDFDPNNLSSDSQPPSDYDPNNKKKARCAHILLPKSDVATPTIGDVNDDGKLELSYVVGWEGIPGSEDYFSSQPQKMRIRTFTIEDRFEKVFGKGKLDFSRFLPPDKQPWTKYMGQAGDNVFKRKTDHMK